MQGLSMNIFKYQIHWLRVAGAKFCHSLVETGSKKPPPADYILTALKSAADPEEVLKAVSLHHRTMEANHVTLALNTLLYTVKKNSRVNGMEITNTDEFRNLCKRLKKTLRDLEPNEVIDSLKVLVYFKIPSDSVIVQQLMQLIRKDINQLSIPQLTFLGFLLRQMPKCPLADALQIALPLVLETQLKLKLDRTNVASLVDTLSFCTKNHLSEECLMEVVNALLGLDNLEWITMDPLRSRSIIISLTTVKSEATEIQKLYKEAVDVCLRNINSYTFEEIELLLNAVAHASRRSSFFYEETFFTEIANLCIRLQINFLQCCMILRKFNTLSFVHRKFLDYTVEKLLDDPQSYLSAGFGVTKTLVGALSNADYKTRHWQVLKEIIPQSKAFDKIEFNLPWIACCLDLAALDLYFNSILSAVFSKEFLDGFMSRSYNKLDYLQLLRLYQCVKGLHPDYKGPFPPDEFLKTAEEIRNSRDREFPLKSALEHGFGGSQYVLTPCTTSLGHQIDHGVVFRQGGNPIAMTNNFPAVLDKLNTPAGSLTCAIVGFPSSWYNNLGQKRGGTNLQLRSMESLGIAVVPVLLPKWIAMPDREKIPFLMQAIRYRCKEVFSEGSQGVVER